MPPRGPKPKPTEQKRREGNPGKRKLPENEPRFAPMPPDCPDWLDDEANAEWARIAPELEEAGCLTRVDRAALAAYCQAWSRWRKAEVALQKDELIIESGKGNWVQNPLVGVANRALQEMRAFLVEFGMTPSSRTRIDVKTPVADNEMDELCDGPARPAKVVNMAGRRRKSDED